MAEYTVDRYTRCSVYVSTVYLDFDLNKVDHEGAKVVLPLQARLGFYLWAKHVKVGLVIYRT